MTVLRWFLVAVHVVAAVLGSAFLLREAFYVNPICFPPHGYTMSGIPGFSANWWPPWIVTRFVLCAFAFITTKFLFLTRARNPHERPRAVPGPLFAVAVARALLVLAFAALILETTGWYDRLMVPSFVVNLLTVYPVVRNAPFWILFIALTITIYMMLSAWYRHPAEQYLHWQMVRQTSFSSATLLAAAVLLLNDRSGVRQRISNGSTIDGIGQLSGYYPAIVWSAIVLIGVSTCVTTMLFAPDQYRRRGCGYQRNVPFQFTLRQLVVLCGILACTTVAFTITWGLRW